MDIDALRAQAEQGTVAAQVALGMRYLDGDGVDEDFAQARHWLALAAERGHPRAQVNLGAIHENGWGVEVDLDQARSLYERAAAQNEFMALVLLARMHAAGRGTVRAPAQAAALYRRALAFDGRVDADEELAEARAFVAEADRTAAGLVPATARSIKREERLPELSFKDHDADKPAHGAKPRGGDGERKSRVSHLPAILTGAAAFLAAASTFYLNVRNDLRDSSREPAPASAPAQAGAPRTLRLKLQRIEVLDDGSVGATDWRFRIEADGRELFELSRRPFIDRVGDNVVMPTTADDAQATVSLLPGQQVLVKVTGDHGGMLGGDSIHGTAMLTVGGMTGPVELKSADAAGRFVFHFGATPARD
ncbi:tetratricopeptide repeat protein [Montanilutibacter psychrotolerans]|uniref:Sel1 repeat family protein n=1 Tax=Montanilutibacter psychrotolerans TaxID=1327343 RepID=A0A3M8T477_9GAMM|nr:tetratricopeptide repeat protein [Lysobacter psychrotolerans]RNF86284.1 sel1 repeat family protein [Lysobacter psychrotolerans]